MFYAYVQRFDWMDENFLDGELIAGTWCDLLSPTFVQLVDWF
jgi:hypothetical protein